VERIKRYYAGKTAWVYAVMFHNVEIGLWKGDSIILHDNDFCGDDLTELRVFDDKSELRLVRVGDGFRERYVPDEELPKETFTRDAAYFLYGENVGKRDNFGIALTEARGKELWFPKSLDFGNITAMRLKIRHYVRTNPIPTDKASDKPPCPPASDPIQGGIPTDKAPDKPGIEIYDFRFAGFEYWSKNNKFEEVRL
jgi:CRISPR-associated protein (TIGR03984 family)